MRCPVHSLLLDGLAEGSICRFLYREVALDKTPESPLGSNEIKPVTLKEINPEYTLEGLMLKLKLQYFGHLMQRAGSLEKTDAGKNECKRRRGQQRMRWLDDTSPTQWT